jgi:hypothetical protein
MLPVVGRSLGELPVQGSQQILDPSQCVWPVCAGIMSQNVKLVLIARRPLLAGMLANVMTSSACSTGTKRQGNSHPMGSMFTWDALTHSVEREDLDQPLRDATLQAIATLSDKLGTEWPEKSLGGRMFEPFFNRAAWTRAYLVEVADAIETVSCLSGWEKLKASLRISTNVAGTLFEIDLAARALRAGLRVALQPRSRGQKSVDLAITAPSALTTPVYVEATTLGSRSRKEREYERIMDQVMPHSRFQMYGLTGGARFFRLPHEEEVSGIVEQVRTFCQERQASRTFGRFEIPGLLELWAGLDENQVREFAPFVDPRQVTGPPLEFDPISRLKVRVDEKIQQLPTLVPCLLVLDLPSHLWFADAAGLASAAETMIGVYRQVNAVALARTMSNSTVEVAAPRGIGAGHLSITRTRYLFHVEETILVRNRAPAYPHGDAAINQLFLL